MKKTITSLTCLVSRVLRYFLALSIQFIVFIGLIIHPNFEAVAADRLAVRVVTVVSRKDAETILTRMRRDTPLALGARGVAQVRTLTRKQIDALPQGVRDTMKSLEGGEHTGIIRGEQAYSIYQATTFDHYREGWALYRKGKTLEAIRKVEKDLIINPDHAQGLVLLGRIFEERGEYRRGVEAYRQLIGFHPNSALGYRMLGRIYEIEKKWNQAAENYEASLELDSRQHDVLNALALIYALRQNQPERGLPLIEKALRLRPNTPEYEDTLAWVRKALKGPKQTRIAKAVKIEKKPAPSPAPKEPKSNSAESRVIKSNPSEPKTANSNAKPSPARGPYAFPPPPVLREREKLRFEAKEWPPPLDVRSQLPVPPVLMDPPAQDGNGKNGDQLHDVLPERGVLYVMNPSLRVEALKDAGKALRFLGSVKKNEPPGRSGSKGVSRSFRIKILDGTGNLANTQRLRSKLMTKGSNVTTTAVSDKGKWEQTVLYYGKGSEAHAEKVAAAIPGRVLLRPLTWKTSYDIILVLGKDKAAN